MGRLVVGLLGVGTVGSGVVRLLDEHSDRIARRAGRPVELKWAVTKDPSAPLMATPRHARLVSDPYQVVRDPEVEVVVEVMGGTDPTRQVVLDALAAGKHVVTANKALLATHGPEIFAQARRSDRAVAFEASVGGGIPIIQAIGVGLAANQVESLAAILNGTCNFILTAMTREGLPYEVALRQAQSLGYAEADPTLDVDGTDTAHKLAILSQLAFGVGVEVGDIPRVGIDRLDTADIRYAGELGYAVKLLALARQSEAGLELRVAPSLVRKGLPLAEVWGPFNAVRVVGDAVGETFFHGRGAGMMPTASAIVGDLIDVALGRAAMTARALDLWPERSAPPRLAPPTEVRRRNYLRFTIADRPGVIARIARVLGDRGISIASVMQHDPGDEAVAGGPVPLVIMTHVANEAAVAGALVEIDQLEVVKAPSVRFGVEE